MPEGNADRIREYATGLVEQARREGRESITIRADDVRKALGLRQAHPTVGKVLNEEIFHRQARVKLVDYEGPPSRMISTAKFVFSILPSGVQPPGDWRKQVLELPIEGFQELFSDYLKAKGFSNAEVEIVIRTRGQG